MRWIPAAVTPDRIRRAFALRAAGLALVQVLAGPPAAGAPQWRTRRHRQVAHGVLAVLSLAVCALSLAALPNEASTAWAVTMTRVTDIHESATMWFLAGGLRRPATLMALAMVLAVAVVAPLPLLARYPLLGWRIGWLALLLVPSAHLPWWGGWAWNPVQVPLLVLAFCVAGVGQHRAGLWCMWTLSIGAWWVWVFRARPGPLLGILSTVAFTAVTLVVHALGTRRRAQQALAERAELERARLAAMVERTRIARELHDVVAHHMALIAVRAESAQYRLQALPAPVGAEFAWLSGAARGAMADMRRLLAVLRQDATVERAPQPQLSQLPALVEAARRAGVPVELSMPAEPDRVPAGVGVCAYRIVQESLSNALRHAPGAPVRVSVDHDDRCVALRVTNGPADTTGPDGTARPAGHGLAGMRERAALLGGSLLASPSPDGGFVVSAVLPA